MCNGHTYHDYSLSDTPYHDYSLSDTHCHDYSLSDTNHAYSFSE